MRLKPKSKPDLLRATLEAFLGQPRVLRLPRVLLVACSGGADSVALLRVAAELGPGLGWRVEALHCDHGLRRESKGDAAFVAALCGRLGLPLHAFATRLGSGAGMESRARLWRRRCYAQAAKAAGAKLVLLAHHAQDQAETLLLNLVRGAGPRGAAGMAALAPLDASGGLLGRPWLGQRPEALRVWLKRRKQSWREDRSNADRGLARNRIRHAVLPQLQAINPKAVEHLAAFAALQEPRPSDLAGLLNLDQGARKRAQALLRQGQGQVDLGRGWTLRASQGQALVELGTAVRRPLPLALQVGPPQAWGEQWVFQLKLGRPSARMLKDDKAFWFSPPVLREALHVRALRPGERMHPYGAAAGSRLLFDLLADAGVPSWQRAHWPVLVAGDKILALPGVRRAQGHAVKAAEEALCFSWRRPA